MQTNQRSRAVCVGTGSDFWVTRLRIAMEALSRLVLRLPPERAEEIFKQALRYYRMEGIANHFWLLKPTDHLLARSWEALPRDRRTSLIFDVLSAPIAGLDGFEFSNQLYPDPGKLLVDDDKTPAPARVPETEGRWTEIVYLIIRGLRTNGEARKRAALRLMPLALWDRLSSAERDVVAQALWQPDQTSLDILPSRTSLCDWVFLLLPEPQPGLAEQQFRKRWLGSQEPKNDTSLNKFFWQLGNGLVSLRYHQRPLTLTNEECANLEAIVERWIKLPVASKDDLWTKFGTLEGIAGLQSILPEIDLSPTVAEELFSKVIALNQTSTPGFRLFAGLAKALSDRLDEVAISMRMGLASDNMTVAEEAVLGLHAWLRAALEEASRVPTPPDDLLREIGVMIATRRKRVLNPALQVAYWIFSNGSSKQRDVIAPLTLHGLQYLIEELRYDRDHGEDQEVDIPLLRWGCAHLALAMSASGYEIDPTVMRWAEVARSDPLPEVRHAESPASVHVREEKAEGK